MKNLTSIRPILLLTFGLILILFSCKKDANVETEPDAIELDIPLEAVNYVVNNQATLSIRARGGDIDDVIAPPASTAPGDSCEKLCPTFPGTFNCDILCHLMRLAKTWEIKPGQRFGIKQVETTCFTPKVESAFSCYISRDTQLCGYNGREKAYPLTIENDGNYRVQLTPLSRHKNLDLFIFKKEGGGTREQTSDVKSLAAWSTFPSDKTETVHLTKKGRYHILVDELASNDDCQNTEYAISISANTNILTVPTFKCNRLVYEFKIVKPIEGMTLVSWKFELKTGDTTWPMGSYPANRSFIFSRCNNYDYLVSPVFKNNQTGELSEGESTLIRP